MLELLAIVESNMHRLVRMPVSREGAIVIRQRISLPLGVLASQHRLVPQREKHKKAVD